MIKEKNFRKCDSVSSASSRRALEHIVPGGHREVLQWDRVRANAFYTVVFVIWIIWNCLMQLLSIKLCLHIRLILPRWR